MNKGVSTAQGGLQPAADKVADRIEFGLDKMGYGIIFSASKIVGAPTAMFKAAKRKAKRRDSI